MSLHQKCGRGSIWNRTIKGSLTQHTHILTQEAKSIHLEHSLAHITMRTCKLRAKSCILKQSLGLAPSLIPFLFISFNLLRNLWKKLFTHADDISCFAILYLTSSKLVLIPKSTGSHSKFIIHAFIHCFNKYLVPDTMLVYNGELNRQCLHLWSLQSSTAI